MGNDSKEQQDSQSEARETFKVHPSRSLVPRARGYGIGGGYETPYRGRSKPRDEQGECYGPLPHSGYYGAGSGTERFKRGQASFSSELRWYKQQYGERTSGGENEET